MGAPMVINECLFHPGEWGLEMTHYLLQSQHLDRPENKLISTLFIQGFWSTQNLYNWSCSGLSRAQVWVLNHAPAYHLAIIPQGYSRRPPEALTPKSKAKFLGQCSCIALAGLTGMHRYRVYVSWLQSLLPATCTLAGKVLPLLLYWLSSTVKRGLMLVNSGSL